MQDLKSKADKQNSEIELVHLELLRKLQLTEKKWGHLESFRDLRKILDSPGTTYLTSLGLRGNNKENIFIFLKEKMDIVFPEENKEAFETVADLTASVYLSKREKHVRVLI